MATIKAVLDLDISRFASNAAAATEVLGKTLGAAAEKQLDRKLGVHDAFKGFFMGLGLNVEGIAQSLARFFADMPEWAEKAYERITAASEKATAALRGQFAARNTPEAQIAALEKEQRVEGERWKGMREQSPGERYEAQLPMVGSLYKNAQEGRGVYSTEEIMAAKAEAQARAQEIGAQIDALKLQSAAMHRAEAAMQSERLSIGFHEPGAYAVNREKSEELAGELSKKPSVARQHEIMLEIGKLVNKRLAMEAAAQEKQRATEERQIGRAHV